MDLAAMLAEAGHERGARSAVEKAWQLQPAAAIGFMRNTPAGMSKTILDSLLDSLRGAGSRDTRFQASSKPADFPYAAS